MKTQLQNLTLILAAIFLTNCSSSFLTLSPDEKSSLDMGRRIIEKETENVFSSISFEDQNSKEYIFHLFVYNKNDKRVTIDPKKIYFKAYDENRDPMYSTRFYAFNPEDEIRNINKEMAEREDEHDVSTGLNIAFSLFDTILDLSDDEDDNVGEVLENVAIFTSNQVGEEIDYSNDMEYLQAQKTFWKNEVLRITELDQEEDTGGIFFTPIISDAKYIKLFIPFGDEVHTYKFKQIVVEE